MKKIILIFFLTTIHAFSYSQSEKINAQIILTSEDTLNIKFKVAVNLFYRDLIEEPSFKKKLTVFPDNKPKYKIYAKDVKSLKFTDLTGQERIFKSTNEIERINKQNQLIEVKVEGKISWYRHYFRNLQDQSVTFVDYFIKDNKPIESKGSLGGIRVIKNILYRLIIPSTIDYSDKIEDLQSDEDVISFIEMYNKME
ncbi:hypothetical protein [Saccharicrinis sp. FJH54]|uniref:hypothetical protein n=1 Tax=Saccharicrinis sp. FJH54 TaxID=3344665 RepID=UPI0035D3F380